MNSLEELEDQARYCQNQIAHFEKEIARIDALIRDAPSYLSVDALRIEHQRLKRLLSYRETEWQDVRLQIARHYGVRDPRPYDPVLDGPRDPQPPRRPQREDDERER